MLRSYRVRRSDNTEYSVNGSNPYIQLAQIDLDESDEEIPTAAPTTAPTTAPPPAVPAGVSKNTDTHGFVETDQAADEHRRRVDPLLHRITILQLPQDIAEDVIKLDQMSCMIRFICISDIILSSIYFMNGYVAGFLFMIASVYGYAATIYYNRSLLCCYLWYQYIQTALRFLNIIIYITTITSTTTTITNTTNTTNSTNPLVPRSVTVSYATDYAVNIIIYVVLFFCQCFITYFVQKYYNLLPSEEKRRRIREYLNR